MIPQIATQMIPTMVSKMMPKICTTNYIKNDTNNCTKYPHKMKSAADSTPAWRGCCNRAFRFVGIFGTICGIMFCIICGTIFGIIVGVLFGILIGSLIIFVNRIRIINMIKL